MSSRPNWKNRRRGRRDYGESRGGPSGSRPERGGRGRGLAGLRGREIGLYYARLSKEKQLQEASKPLATVLLSETVKQEINLALDSFQVPKPTNTFKNSNERLNQIADSDFKREFVGNLDGNLNSRIDDIDVALEQNEILDQQLYDSFKLKSENKKYLDMMKFREKLPSFKMKSELLDLINSNNVVVISGETGCGKTTQVAQFILDDYIEKKKGSLCKIICTQPRRISAVSVAERVAEERGESLGSSVGFSIRLERALPREKGCITFCTTGILLKHMESDPGLSTISHLILDEIHERDVLCDFLITIIKQVLGKRQDLKVILMSATLNSEAFSRYFNNAPHINIPGFTFPVTEYFLEDVIQRTQFVFEEKKTPFVRRYTKKAQWEFSNFIEPHVRQLEAEKKYDRNVCIQLRRLESEEINVDLVYELILNICKKEKDPGAILVFLTGYGEISNLHSLMEKSGSFPQSRYRIFPLHSQMPTVDQKQIFLPPPSGVRKIIISTNIAETSITIDDVVFVIDCGKIKISNYDVESNTATLQPEWVSLANANQRRGRAGRVRPGICFHLISKARYMMLEQFQKPEILRTRLDNVILKAKMLQLGKIEPFFQKLPDPPEERAVSNSIQLLQRLDALDDDENLTPLGYHLAKLPIGPQMGKMILMGAIFSCLEPVLCVAASLDFKDAFQIPLGKEKEADRQRKKLAEGWKSDHLILYRALKLFETVSNKRQFCYEYFLSFHTLQLLVEMKSQFMQYLFDMKFVSNLDPSSDDCNVNSTNLSLVKAIVCSGLYPNVALCRMKKNHPKLFSVDGEKLKFHPKSVFYTEKCFESPILVFYIKLKTSANFLHDVTMVHPLPIIFFGDHYERKRSNNINVISINRKLLFRCSESTADIIKNLRDKMVWFLNYKISHPGFVDWSKTTPEIHILRCIMKLITSEDLGDIDSDAFDDYDDI